MTNADDVKDTAITVKLGATTLGTAALDNTVQAALPGFDEAGTASVDLKIPATTPVGPATLTLTGAVTGTERTVPITVAEGQEITAGRRDRHVRRSHRRDGHRGRATTARRPAPWSCSTG